MKEEQMIIDLVCNILQLSRVPVCFLPLQDKDLGPPDNSLQERILQKAETSDVFDKMFRSLKKKNVYQLTDILQCNYTILWLPKSEQWMFCGPVLFEEIKYERLQKIFQELKLPEELQDTLHEHYLKATLVSAQESYENIFIVLADRLYGKGQYSVVYDNGHELDEWYHYYQNFYRVPENPLRGVKVIEERYELENALIGAIEHADEPKAMELAAKISTLVIPPRMPNAMRDMKDYCITSNTLMRKAAETAGVHPIYIDAFSNRNVQKIEQLISQKQARNLIRKMARGYCQLIHRHTLPDYSTLIRKVITYVNTDVRANLTLHVLAEELSVNASYLSTLFKKEMGCTLTDYVNQCRIRHARKLLLSTDMPIKNVAAASGIADVYYFNRLFKRMTGSTPKAYREIDSFERQKELSALNNSNITYSGRRADRSD